jgi:hypothetical protein
VSGALRRKERIDSTCSHDLSTSAMSTPDKAAASLKSRLDGLKDEHRQDLLQLAAQRDDLAREVADLTRQRDHLTEENVVLEARSMELTAQHREAVKQLEGAREATALQRQPYNISLRGHQKTSTSLGSSASSNGSYDTTSDAGLMQGHRIEQAQPARKFKWGKGKPIDAKASSGHTHKGSQNSVTLNGRTAPSTDIAIRQHLFQPVSILRPVRCEHCGDKMWGLQELRCAGAFLTSPEWPLIFEKLAVFIATRGVRRSTTCSATRRHPSSQRMVLRLQASSLGTISRARSSSKIDRCPISCRRASRPWKSTAWISRGSIGRVRCACTFAYGCDAMQPAACRK